ncbi:hypothetical protein QO009_004114 [Brevibacillus aydinogluensis]|jgi:hypothetical protein|uniref:hypothetical protein n=1 Tax=Brevibacillus aydinogluensis TaxID=927786 RepID=UPI002892BA8C|nr:hypothetical protein [Brevibacillus aydinogluensis]MDT3418189.1 hypothetical protein [Brevibacillus aydinogluensis]
MKRTDFWLTSTSYVGVVDITFKGERCRNFPVILTVVGEGEKTHVDVQIDAYGSAILKVITDTDDLEDLQDRVRSKVRKKYATEWSILEEKVSEWHARRKRCDT